jgi:hypothetical protein
MLSFTETFSPKIDHTLTPNSLVGCDRNSILAMEPLKLKKKTSFASIVQIASPLFAPSPSPRGTASITAPVATYFPTRKERRLAPWDRTVDVIFHRYRKGDPCQRKVGEFATTVEQFRMDHGRDMDSEIEAGYFLLPPEIRFRICQYVLGDEVWNFRPVALTDPRFDQDAWPPTHFTDPAGALESVWPYMSVCFDMYADMAVTFLMECRFHVTFSPFVGRRLNPLATNWLETHGRYMQHIILEVDMTRLGSNTGAGASELRIDTANITGLVEQFVGGQLRRRGRRKRHSTLRSLVLLGRRFYGERPPPAAVSKDINSIHEDEPISPTKVGTPSGFTKPPVQKLKAAERRATILGLSPERPSSRQSFGTAAIKRRISSPTKILSIRPSTPIHATAPVPLISLVPGSDTGLAPIAAPYCPEESLYACNSLFKLRGLVDSIRTCGFSSEYTHKLIHQIFILPGADDLKHHAYRIAPSTLYPRLPGQYSWVDAGDNNLILDDHAFPGPGSLILRSTGAVVLPMPTVSDSGETSVPNLGIMDIDEMEVSSDSIKQGRFSPAPWGAADSGGSASKLMRLVDRLRRKSQPRRDVKTPDSSLHSLQSKDSK